MNEISILFNSIVFIILGLLSSCVGRFMSGFVDLAKL